MAVRLNWQDNSDNETSMLVERRVINTGSFAQIASLPANTETYLDSSVVVDTTYEYRLRTSNSAGNSAYSNTAIITATAAAPADELFNSSWDTAPLGSSMPAVTDGGLWTSVGWDLYATMDPIVAVVDSDSEPAYGKCLQITFPPDDTEQGHDFRMGRSFGFHNVLYFRMAVKFSSDTVWTDGQHKIFIIQSGPDQQNIYINVTGVGTTGYVTAVVQTPQRGYYLDTNNPIPIGSWVILEVYVKAGANGHIFIKQNGVELNLQPPDDAEGTWAATDPQVSIDLDDIGWDRFKIDTIIHDYQYAALQAVLPIYRWYDSVTVTTKTWGAATPSPPLDLTPSGPITITANGQIVQNLYITANGSPGINNPGYSDVLVRRCKIDHKNAHGITFTTGCNGMTFEDLDITRIDAPSGQNPLPSSEENGINGYNCSGITGTRLRFRNNSTGVYLQSCSAPSFTFLEGYDMKGPFPRGQLIQYDRCHNGIIEDFSCINDAAQSWPEDNVNIYLSSNVSIRRGLLVGNNSPSGIGIIFEQFSEGVTGGLVEDVDCQYQGNGSFSAYLVGYNITFRRTRSRDNFVTDQGRGAPLSNALIWASGPGSTGNRITQSRYFNPAVPGNIVYDASTLLENDIVEGDYTQRSPIVLTMPWE